MFLLQRPSPEAIARFLAKQRDKSFSYSEAGASLERTPPGYTVDHNRVHLGQGSDVFRQAIASLRAWRMFDLGWVELIPTSTPIQAGETVAILVRHFGFWSLNAARLVYAFDEPRRFGFAYGTLLDHAEQGEERFSVEWRTEDDSVWYDILAFSRPRQWQARVARSLSRALQRRFARDSMAAMRRAVRGR